MPGDNSCHVGGMQAVKGHFGSENAQVARQRADELAALDAVFADLIPELKGDNPGNRESALPGDNSGNAKHRPSLYRDAAFAREIEASAGTLDGETSVSSTPTPPYPSNSALSPNQSLPPNTPTKLRLWQNRLIAPPVGKHRVPPKWRETTIHLRSTFAFKALCQLGPVVGFTLNLSPEIESQARSQAAPLDWLHRRLHRTLKAVLGRPVAFLIALEEAEDHTRRLHLHGVLQLDASDRRLAVRVRKALRLAGGEWQENRQRQCRFNPETDAGWISYALKNAWKTSPAMRRRLQGSTLRVKFSGDVFSATKDVWRLASEIYTETRTKMISHH